MKLSPRITSACLSVLLAFMVSTLASAETLTGTLKNGTSGKPAAGDEVILIKLGQGMEEAARTKADASGHFSFNLPDAGPHLIRAIHQDVTYHRMAPPGTTSVELEVYDVAKKVEGVSVTADVMRFQAESNQLQGIRLFAVNNSSSRRAPRWATRTSSFFCPKALRSIRPWR